MTRTSKQQKQLIAEELNRPERPIRQLANWYKRDGIEAPRIAKPTVSKEVRLRMRQRLAEQNAQHHPKE